MGISLILSDASKKIIRFNDIGFHYNLVADEIYRKRDTLSNLFGELFQRYIIAGLVTFEMERMMGSNKYDFHGNGFGFRLNSKLQTIKSILEPLLTQNLAEIDLNNYNNQIKGIYKSLSDTGINALHDNQGKAFHVGATKILHFINPHLFIIIDSNATRSYQKAFGEKKGFDIHFKNTTQPGYSPDMYYYCLKAAQLDILNYGLEQFKALELGTPITRIYDKLTFITGLDIR